MKAVILAAGKAERLKGIVDTVPKPMIEFRKKPILQHNIEWLRNSGITDIYINLHHLPDIIRNYFGEGEDFSVKITYSYERQLLGTAGAVGKIAALYWKNESPETFIVAYGDNVLSDFDLVKLTDFHNQKSGIGTICLYPNPQQISKSGVAVLNGDNRIIQFVEKPSGDKFISDLVNTGLYVLSPGILKYIPVNSYSDFGKDIFNRVIADHQSLYGLVMKKNLIAVDTPELLRKVSEGTV